MNLAQLLEQRGLPQVAFPSTATGWWRRHIDLEQLLRREAYGQLPAPPRQLTAQLISVDERFCAGKAPLRQVRLTAQLSGGSFTFPVSVAAPKEKPTVRRWSISASVRRCPINICPRRSWPTGVMRWHPFAISR